MSELELTTLGKYELLRELGRGSMAAVYLARDPFTLQEVAIKVASATPNANERISRRRRKLFYNESKAAGLLHHENIVAIIDAGEDDGVRYIVMEYVRGAQTLDKFCRAPDLLPVENVVQLLIKCALAFDYAHSKGVIHRDVKPRNILLTPENDIKIGDFGIALIERDDIENTQVIGTLGSPRYMAPEQVTGAAVSRQTDVFALGVVAYELLTGEHPFADRTVAQIVQRITRTAHRPLRELNPDIPGELAHIVDRTLKKHPAGRYATALDLAGDLSLVYDDIRLASQAPRVSQRVDRLAELDFFVGFGEDALREVMNFGQWREFSAGEHILTEGGSTDSFCVLVDGQASVRCAGQEVTVLTPGASFGELGLVIRRPGLATVAAKTDVSVLEVRASMIDKTSLSGQLGFQRAFVQALASRLAATMDFVADSIADRGEGSTASGSAEPAGEQPN